MATFILAFLLQCFFPILDSGSNDFLGLSVVNTDSAQREVTVTVRSPEGTGAQTGRIAVPAGAQRARLLREILGTSPGPAAAWIQMDGLSSTCAGYVLHGNEESLAGLEPALFPGASDVLIPHVEVNTGFMELNHTETSVAIVNPNAMAATVNARLFTLSGVLRGTATVQVPVQGSRTFRIAELFSNALPDNNAGGKTFQGYLRLSSDVGIAAWQRLNTPRSSATLRGRAVTELRSTSFATFPHFVFGGDYGSILNLINPGTASLALELTAHDDRGNALGETVRLTLAPGEARRSSVGEFLRVVTIQIFPQPNIPGHIRVREVQGQPFQITGSIEVFRTTLGAPLSSMLGWISDAASVQWTLPFSSTAPPYFTGYAVVNPNELLTVQTDVTIELLDVDGALVNRSTVSLSPRNRHASIAAAGLSSGYMRIRANFPIHVLGTIGTHDGQRLDQLPEIR